MRFLPTALVVMISLIAASAHAAHTQATLWLSATTAKPGDTVWAGIDLKMATGWHTYWKNPGAAGQATEIKWQLPPGLTNGDIQWPPPEKLPPIEVTTYGYQNEIVLLVPLKIAGNCGSGLLTVQANVSWLECHDVCIPAQERISASMNIGPESQNSDQATILAAWQAKLPRPGNFLAPQAHWELTTNEDDRNLILDVTAPGATADFFPDGYDNFEIEAPIAMRPTASGRLELVKPAKKFSGDWPSEVSGLIVLPFNGAHTAYAVKFAITNVSGPAAALR